MASTLCGALVEMFDGSPTLAADFPAQPDGTPGGLWVGAIPETAKALPLVVLVQDDEIPQQFFRGTVTTKGTFSFVIEALGLARAEALANDLKAVFDPSSTARTGQIVNAPVKLDITGTANNWILRKGYRIRPVEYRAADSSWVYEITLPYESFVEYLT